MDKLYHFLLSNSYTYSLMRHRIRLLKSVLSNRIFGSNLQVNPSADDVNWFNSIPQDFINQIDQNNLTDTINFLEESLEKTPYLIINIAFDPSPQAEAQIGEFCRKNFTSFSLISIRYNPVLIAGCSLVWQSIAKDYSIKARMAQYKDSILESFKMTLK